ncbi:Outer membrane receptor protein, mostly Fe transport [Caldithrix abyssi DSM 13497]|uniref:Outer membrane receptor protein, mostly Fe transport n=1 Tax=Caldithrix abyssi DSM 13497 TaxID=880073 RepID=A0A1J1C6S8_CALAY|nr:Outer membrane receptor protein, mostly Fe transport [Caldithrix abyssi DSM 13497]
MEEQIVIVAERPLVEKHVTQSVSRVTTEEIEAMPIRGSNAIIALQPSVVLQDGNIHIRGGRAEDNGYYLDGAPTINPMNRVNAVHVIQEAIEEIQVLKGGYTAEFGDANAGIIRTELKTGGPEFHFSLDAQTDKFASEGEKFLGTYSYREHIIAATASGPITKNLRFFIAYENQDVGDNAKRFSSGYTFKYPDNLNNPLVDTNPRNPRNDPNNPAYHPDTLDAITYPDGYTPNNWYNRHSVNSTLLWDMQNFKVRLSGVYSFTKSFSYRAPMLNVFNTREQPYYNNNLLLSGKITHVLNPKTYYELTLSYYLTQGERHDDWFGTDWRSWRDSAKIADYTDGRVIYRSKWDPDYSYLINGFNFLRDGTLLAGYSKNKQTYLNAAFDMVSQITRNHEVKFGFNARQYTIRQYSISPGVMKEVDVYGSEEAVPDQVVAEWAGNVFGYDLWGNKEVDSGFDGAKKPVFAAAYIQDKIEYKDLIVNVGLRFDYFDTKDRKLKNPADVDIDKDNGIVKPDQWIDKDPFMYVTPRLGFSFPVSDRTVFYAQYGKFVQTNEFNDFYYSSYQYGRQIGGGYFYLTPVGFDMEPIRTTQYEVGFRQQFGQYAAIDIAGFYKNVKGEVTTDRITPVPGAEIQSYNILTNGDFSTTKGVEISFRLRRFNRLMAIMNYTYSDAEGTGSGQNSYISAVDRLSARPTQLNPLDYAQKHRGTVNLDYRFGKKDGGPVFEQFGINLLYSFNSGHPYTMVTSSGGQAGPYDSGVDYMIDTRSRRALEPINNSTTPWYHRFDLRVDKSFDVTDKLTVTLYARVYNLFNTKNVINVYQITGSAEDDGLLSGVIDPARARSFISAYGGEDYVKMYETINLENGQAYWHLIGRELYSTPRQIFFGLKLSF